MSGASKPSESATPTGNHESPWTPTPSLPWTDEALSQARNAGIARRVEQGWSLTDRGLLVQGTGRSKVEMRPTSLMPSRTGEPDYNPGTDAFALVLGADCEGPNRYRSKQFPVLLDANGACRDEAECPECGSDPIVQDDRGDVASGGQYRFRVYGLDGRRTYCRRCVTQQELDAVRDRATEAAAKSIRNGGRR